MTDSISLLMLATVAVLLVYAGLGYEAAYEITYGAFTLVAAMVSLTFLWLWLQRATPLAEGMALSWAGSASVMGWWWIYNLLNGPAGMHENAMLLLFLSVYFVGAIMHFSVIGRSLGASRNLWLVPVILAILASTLLHVIRS